MMAFRIGSQTEDHATRRPRPHHLFTLFAVLIAIADAAGSEPFRETPVLAPGASWSRSLGGVEKGDRFELVVSLATPRDDDRLTVELSCHGFSSRKILHAGDPDLYLPIRPDRDGEAAVRLVREGPGTAPLPVQVSWLTSGRDDPEALEAEPNDDWRSANRMILGRAIHGSADDVDWLQNAEEGRAGLDWFRFDVDSEGPFLATFTLDLVDPDVSSDLALFQIEGDRPVPHLDGKDPMETIHDREPVRYSKNLVRTLTKGTYFLRVNANHPAYVLRSRTSAVPPFDDPQQAVEAGLHYLLNAGDAWLGQVPREGNRFVRSANLHETSLRCTGCHATSFPAEAALTARRAGYAIEARPALLNMIDRIADSPAPLYGDTGLNWQRYIATPLEAQGAQGGVLIDVHQTIADVPTPTLARFGPFLSAAWAARTTLPDDEHNVIPAESKFSQAWKGWRVLSELARRSGREDEARVAAQVAAIATSRAADRRVESLQDRIHRLIAWSLTDREANANKIRREAGALIALQNPDGGWHESDAQPGPSAVYATGQMVDALLEAGVRRDHPAVDRALKYLLASQQAFGGWFQTDTHENFRTPMRETRWAVAALARAFPKDGGGGRGWGGPPAKPPRTDSLAHAMDDLEAAWDPPATDAPGFLATVAALLDHDSPLVRASAASCLGRIGEAENVAPLISALDDSSKIVRHAAGSALRRLGNRGVGVDATIDALNHASPRVRREATALLSRQVHGFEGRSIVVERLAHRAEDSDFLTRFKAVRALRRWFYRTRDTAERRRIVETLVARLAVERAPLLRRNLAENLYILMDENLGGGVSLQRNLTALPEPIRGPVLEARRDVERVAILGPILAALRDGGDLQRVGVLRAFDGSFLRGRTYAKRPEGAVDVGNDREFGFLFVPPIEEAEPALAPLLATTNGPERRDALRLADFFQVFGRSRSPDIQAAVLAGLDDPDAETRSEALRIVEREMSFDGAEENAELIGRITAHLAGPAEARTALVSSLSRNPALLRRPEVAKALATISSRLDASPDLLPILDRLGLSNAEVVAALDRGWERFDPGRKAQALDVLLRLPPSEAVATLLARAAADPSETIRERAVAARIGRTTTSDETASALLPALADPAPKIRRLALASASQRASFWGRADAMEALARTLVDLDAEVRSGSLDVVKHHHLLARFPILARRVKALTTDPALAPRALAMLKAAGRDPSEIAPDVAVDRPLILDLDAFRRDVNPLLYRRGADGHACVDCHATHSVLRLASRRDGGPDEGDVALNFASAARVVDLARPESSLLLRKPRSPHGQGEPDPEGPTGVTHAGGPRWDDVDDPAYRTVLAWIRASAAQSDPLPPLTPDLDPPDELEPARDPISD